MERDALLLRMFLFRVFRIRVCPKEHNELFVLLLDGACKEAGCVPRSVFDGSHASVMGNSTKISHERASLEHACVNCFAYATPGTLISTYIFSHALARFSIASNTRTRSVASACPSDSRLYPKLGDVFPAISRCAPVSYTHL